MSVSSYSSQCNSSSSSSSSSSSGSSSSSSSSSTSSGATGEFSSSAISFSSCSTIVEAQPTVRPFGHPVFNYFWIEKRSKTFPKRKYYWNFKSDSVAWERPVPKDVPLPIYTNNQNFVEPNLSDNEDIIVSEPEDAIRRKRRLEVKKRNRRLAFEEKDDAIEVLSVKKTIKSKKMLDTFWKLYRYPGESVKDVKKRILNCIENTVRIKSEFDSSYNEYNGNDVMGTSEITIKQEPLVNEDNDLSFNLNDSITVVKKDVDEESDSDPEHVSRLIKQEYMVHYEGTDEEDEYRESKKVFEVPDEETEKDSEDEDEDEDSEEDDEEIENSNDIHQDYFNNNEVQNANEMLESETDNFEYEYEAPCLQEDLLSVEINEDSNGKIFLPEDDVVIEKVNWNFDPSETVNNSALTSSAITSVYGAPKMKEIRSKYLLSNRKKRKVRTQKKKIVPKLVIKKEPCFNVKSEPESSGSEKPIICDRYGVRTINYNHPPKVKLANWRCYTKLTDSGSDSSEDSDYKSNKINPSKTVGKNANDTLPTSQRKDEGALELRNWFPKKRGRKRKIYNKAGSDSSWCETDLSDYSSVSEFDRRLIKIKKEKRSSSAEREVYNPMFKNKIVETSIKKEIQNSSPAHQPMESKLLGSLTPPAEPEVDLNRVKVEVTSDLEEQSSAVKVEENAANDSDHSDSNSSSGSTHTCSRSSCSCCPPSSSSASSNGSDNEHDADNQTIKTEQDV